jgi:hypothetical protein
MLFPLAASTDESGSSDDDIQVDAIHYKPVVPLLKVPSSPEDDDDHVSFAIEDDASEAQPVLRITPAIPLTYLEDDDGHVPFAIDSDKSSHPPPLLIDNPQFFDKLHVLRSLYPTPGDFSLCDVYSPLPFARAIKVVLCCLPGKSPTIQDLVENFMSQYFYLSPSPDLNNHCQVRPHKQHTERYVLEIAENGKQGLKQEYTKLRQQPSQIKAVTFSNNFIRFFGEYP